MSEGDSPPASPEDDGVDFHEIANLFLTPANQMAGQHDIAEIAAAFIYACSRYNAFAMQSQAEDLADHRDEAAEMLTAHWTEELRQNMAQSLQRNPAKPPPGVKPTDALDFLAGVEDLGREERSRFMEMADQFINVANSAPISKVSRLSAGCMHACARFNVFVMQASGQTPGTVDEGLVDQFTAAYRRLVEQHLLEVLVAQRQ